MIAQNLENTNDMKNTGFGHEVTCHGAWSIRGSGVVKLNFAVEKLNFAVERLNFAVVTKTPKIHQNLEQIEHLSFIYQIPFDESKSKTNLNWTVMNDI